MIIEVQSEGITEELTYHMSVDDITLSQFIDFKVNDQKSINEIRDLENPDSRGEYYRAKAIQLIMGGSDEFWDTIDYTDDDLVADFFDIDNQEITVLRLYTHYFNLFNGYIQRKAVRIKNILSSLSEEKQNKYRDVKNLLINKSVSLVEMMQAILTFSELEGNLQVKKQELSFFHGDTKYYIGPKSISKYSGGSFTTGQSLVLKQIRKSMRMRIDKLKDAEGAIDMELSLYELAVLCQEEGEKLPFNPSERHQYMINKGNKFKDIPMTQYYEISFFLIISLRGFIQTQTIDHFSKTFTKMSENPLMTRIQRSIKMQRKPKLIRLLNPN